MNIAVTGASGQGACFPSLFCSLSGSPVPDLMTPHAPGANTVPVCTAEFTPGIFFFKKNPKKIKKGVDKRARI